jgi:hypothetical protein
MAHDMKMGDIEETIGIGIVIDNEWQASTNHSSNPEAQVIKSQVLQEKTSHLRGHSGHFWSSRNGRLNDGMLK